MVEVEERYMIRELHRHGVSISEIARQTGRDRKTVRKAVGEPLLSPARKRQRKGRKIDPYTAYLDKRIAEGVHNARKLYGEIAALGYAGKESMVRYYVQPHRQRTNNQATVRFETEPGEQAQVDWGHFGYIQHQGRRQRLYAFVMTLGWSRMMYLEFTVSANIAWWLRCHRHAFHYFGGVTREVLHDNLKTAVLSRSSNGQVHWHPRYLDFAEYYGFQPRACQPYRAQTKGKVENGVRYVRGNFWLGLHYIDLADLNQQALGWLNTVANVRTHGTTGEMPSVRLAQESLLPIHQRPDYDTSLVTYRQSSRDCLVSYEGNLYSVPAAYAQQQLRLRITETNTLYIYSATDDEIAHHQLSEGKSQRIVVAAHYQELHPWSARPVRQGAIQEPAPVVTYTSLVLDAPQVQTRPLSVYAQLVEVSHE
ncbi:MAG: IS21 family transposase [Caldilineaceae bacterium]|nr:IS21 family transposase [Caldilineaceae bacterium]